MCNHLGRKVGLVNTADVYECPLKKFCVLQFEKHRTYRGHSLASCDTCPENTDPGHTPLPLPPIPERVTVPIQKTQRPPREPEPELIYPETPCIHRGNQELIKVGCGCGGGDQMIPVYTCSEFGYCLEPSINKYIRYDGKKVETCVGCGKYQS